MVCNENPRVTEWLGRIGELVLSEAGDLETRALCGAVLRTSWHDLATARQHLRRAAWTSSPPETIPLGPPVSAWYKREPFSLACRSVIDLEKAARFMRSGRLEFWASLMEFTSAEVDAMRERFVSESTPVVRDLRRHLEDYDGPRLAKYRWLWGDLDA